MNINACFTCVWSSISIGFLQQNRHCHRHHHQPEALQRGHWWEKEALLHLRGHRSEEIHRGPAGEEADRHRCYEVHHRGVGHRIWRRSSAVPGSILRLLHGRVLQRQRQTRPHYLRRSFQTGENLVLKLRSTIEWTFAVFVKCWPNPATHWIGNFMWGWKIYSTSSNWLWVLPRWPIERGLVCTKWLLCELCFIIMQTIQWTFFLSTKLLVTSPLIHWFTVVLGIFPHFSSEPYGNYGCMINHNEIELWRS